MNAHSRNLQFKIFELQMYSFVKDGTFIGYLRIHERDKARRCKLWGGRERNFKHARMYNLN